MKNKKVDKKNKSNKSKEIIMKCLLIFSALILCVGIILGGFFIFSDNDVLGVGLTVGGIVLSGLCIVFVFKIGFKIKEETDIKDYKIKTYNCAIKENIEERMSFLYDGIIHSAHNKKNFFSMYRKGDEVVVIAVMYVGELFNEEEFVTYMNEIPELVDRTICHTLIVIFIEEEKSQYLKEIIYTPEYYGLRDTKVFSIYDDATKRLKVNVTNSGIGNKAYNDVKKDLNKIFQFYQKN